MSDIKKIGNKYYDFGCRNKSYLKTAKELQTLGIKNYYFMLEVKNPNVADIDPYKPNITENEMVMFLEELKNNVWFYGATVSKIRSDAGIVDFSLHRGLAAAIWCFERGNDFCLCEPRQTYKTSGILTTICSWAFQLSQNLHMHFFGKDSVNTKRNLATLKDDIKLLPQWLQFEVYNDELGVRKKARKATERLENGLMKNTVVMHPKPQSESHAQGMGRGASAAVMYFDEVEHMPYFDIVLSNSAPAFKTASDNAKSAGSPYGRIFTTTPGNLDTKEGIASYPVIQSMIPWTEKIYDMSDEQLIAYKNSYIDSYADVDIVNKREVIDVFYMEYQYYQVGKNYEWLMEQYKLSGDKMSIRREILLQRLRGSSDSPLSPEDVEYLISNMKRPDIEIMINDLWVFNIYEHGQGEQVSQDRPFNPDIPYLIGIDPASGGGGDNFAIVIINPYNLEIAAEFKHKYISLTPAIALLITLITKYIPRGVMIPERNSLGVYLIQAILEYDELKYNLYWKKNDKELEDIIDESESDYELRKMSEVYKKYGTYVSTKVRSAMFELLFKVISECKPKVTTSNLVDELCKLVRTKQTGRIEAIAGEHDDTVMAYLHTIYIYNNGDNLETFGIDKNQYPVFDDIVVEHDVYIGHDNLYSADAISFEQIQMNENIDYEGNCRMLSKMTLIDNGMYYDNYYERNDVCMIPASFFDEINGNN